MTHRVRVACMYCTPSPLPAMRSLLVLSLLLASGAARAQVGLDFTLGPVISWPEDVQAFTFDPEDPAFDPTQIEVGNPETFNFKPTVGFEAGLGLIIMPRNVGVRVGVHYLNTSAVFDEQGGSFERDAFGANFVTLQGDLRVGKRVGPAMLYAFGGPELRFLVDLSDEDAQFTAALQDSELLSTAAKFGAGVTLNVFGTKFGPKVSYTLGLSDVESGDVIVTRGAEDLALRLPDGYGLNTLLFGLVIGGR